MAKVVRALEALVLVFFVLFAAQACGDDPAGASGGPPDQPPPSNPQPEPDAKQRTIGPEGGEVTSADGRVELIVPPGALSSPQQITIAEADPAGSAGRGARCSRPPSDRSSTSSGRAASRSRSRSESRSAPTKGRFRPTAP